jgi:hypothetical protein
MSAAWVSAAVATASAVKSNQAENSAKKKQKKWRQRGLDILEDQYAQTREDWAPWRIAGEDALGQMEDPLAHFKVSPGYQFRRDEGTRNIENVFSAKQGGGNAMRALTEFNQNTASNEFTNWWNRQAQRAGLGTTGVAGTSVASANYGNQAANQYGQLADNLGSIGMWGATEFNNALNSGVSNYLYGAGMGA